MPDQAAPKGQGLPGWVIALIVVSGLCVCGLPMVGGAVAVLVPKIQLGDSRQSKVVCADRLRLVGRLHVTSMVEDPGLPHGGGGVPYFLHLTATAPQGGMLLVCSDDPSARPAEVVQLGTGEMTEQSAPALQMICSYMVRDFRKYPIGEDFGREIIAADRDEFHRGGINILYSDGSVHFQDREALGLPEGAPIVVGPDSEHEELKKLCLVPAR